MRSTVRGSSSGQRLALIALLVVLAACAGPAQWRYEAALEERPAAAAHALHDERLRQLMRGLDRLRNERLPKTLDTAGDEAREAAQISRVARALAESATQLVSSAPPGAGEPDRAAFRELALELDRQARSLAEDAPTLTRGQGAARLAEIDATCAGCHGRFRIPETPSDGR